jgi:hypothetical protein
MENPIKLEGMITSMVLLGSIEDLENPKRKIPFVRIGIQDDNDKTKLNEMALDIEEQSAINSLIGERAVYECERKFVERYFYTIHKLSISSGRNAGAKYEHVEKC